MAKFEVTQEEKARVREWLKTTVYPAVIEQQRKTEYPEGFNVAAIAKLYWDKGFPWEGAISGGLTYSFTDTSIGRIIKASYGEYVLDLTDYASW